MRSLFHKHGHIIINIFLLVCLGRYTVDRGSGAIYEAYSNHTFNYAELAFFLHNIVMLTFIMLRGQHRAIEARFIPQAIALFAFFSGMLFVQTRTDSVLLMKSGQIVITIAMILSTVTLLNLGRSFGILIAFREVKTGGMYGVIRHPMYCVDILWRVGIVMTWPSAVNFFVFVISIAAYVYRALLEEDFLSIEPAYQRYMERVRYRFIPGVF